MSSRRVASDMFQILDADGIEVGPVPKALGDDELVAMLRLCIFGRDFDKKAIALQRRGKLGTFAPMSGQEAVVVGSVFALDRDHDWVVPQYREQLAMLHWGLPSVHLLPAAPRPSTAARTCPSTVGCFPSRLLSPPICPMPSAWRGE